MHLLFDKAAEELAAREPEDGKAHLLQKCLLASTGETQKWVLYKSEEALKADQEYPNTAKHPQ